MVGDRVRAHVRDVLALFRDRVVLTLSRDQPEFGWWDHEAAAVDERYNEQDPREVAAALATNAAGLARACLRQGTRHGTGQEPAVDANASLSRDLLASPSTRPIIIGSTPSGDVGDPCRALGCNRLQPNNSRAP